MLDNNNEAPVLTESATPNNLSEKIKYKGAKILYDSLSCKKFNLTPFNI